MFDGLDEVAWGTLNHATGKATDVPQNLRALCRGDAAARAAAFTALFYALAAPGGKRFPASVEVVPFLREIAATEACSGRAEALVVLAQVLTGDAVTHATTGFDPTDPVVKKLVAKGPEKDAFDAVRAGVADFVGMLDDGDARVRGAASFLVSFLPDAADAALPRLRAMVDGDRDPFARANAAMALGTFALYRKATDDLPRLTKLAADPALPVVVRGAAAAAARRRPATPDDIEALASLGGVPNVDPAQFPWKLGQVSGLALQVLPELGEAGKERAAAVAVDRALAAAAEKKGPNDARPWSYAMAALRSLFAPRKDEITPGETTPAQRALVARVTEHDLPANYAEYGLPNARADRRRWLGLDAGPLDEVVTFAGAERPLWKAFALVLHKEASPSELEKVLDALSPEEAFAAYGDAAQNAYNVSIPSMDPLRRLAERHPNEGERWARAYAKDLLARRERKERVTDQAAVAALWPLLQAKLDEGYTPLLAMAARNTAAQPVQNRCGADELLAAFPEETRNRAIAAGAATYKDAKLRAKYLDPLLAKFPGARAAVQG